MPKAFLTLLMIAAFANISFSQNLVPNPEFEQVIRCDTVHGPILLDTLERSTQYLKNWFSPINIDAQSYYSFYFNHCFSPPRNNSSLNNRNIYIRSGQGVAGLILKTYASWLKDPIYYWRSFARVKLLKELQPNCIYQVQFYVHLGKNIYTYVNDYGATDAIGAHFSSRNDTISLGTISPQISNPKGNILNDSTQFVLISGLYTATGGEKYLTIGNFKLNDSTTFQQLTFRNPNTIPQAFYYLDDVSVIPVTAANYSLNLGPDQMLCNNQPINQTLTAPSGFAAYEWSTGATTASINITQPGTYWVNADFGCGFLTDTIHIRTRQSFEQGFSLGNDTVICASGSFNLPLKAKAGFDSYRWNTGATARNINATAPGKYWVEATYACGTIADTIEIKQFVPQKLLAVKDTVLCAGQNLMLEAAAGYTAYKWNSGQSTQQIQTSGAGKYKVTATTTAGCLVSDSVEVSFKVPLPGFYLGNDTVLCENQRLEIDLPEKPATTYLWNDGLQTASRQITKPGKYRLTATDRCSTVSAEIEVKFQDCNTIFIPNIITPNKDGRNDLFKIITPTNRKLNLAIYNRWGVLVYEKLDYQNNWPPEKVSSGVYYYLVTDPELNKNYKGWLEVMN